MSSLVLFLKSIFFSWEEGQDKRSSIRFSVVNNPWQSCKMNKGGAPSGQRAATQKRLRDIAEEMNPDAKTQREEVGKEAKRNFFSRDITRQSLPNIDIEMSSEPTATPVFTTRTTPVADPLLALHPPPKKIDQRVDGQVYRHEDGLLKGVRVKWSASSKTYFCTCDLSVHQGNCKTSRCPLLTGKRTSASTESSQTVEQPRTRLVGGASSSKATINYDNMHLDPGHMQSLTSIKHIPACSETASPAITILQKGTWTDKMLQMTSWSGSIFTGGAQQRYPFRVGAQWRREIVGGQYAAVVNKTKVTLVFTIKLNATTAETPVFAVRDYHAGVFAKEFTAQSFSKLALLWLTQHGRTGVTLADMQGKKFVGLDNPGVAEYFCSITSGYTGFRRNMRTRGAGDKGVVGDRQKRRQEPSLNDEFVMLLRKTCPANLSHAFSVLKGTNSFKDLFRDSSQTLENNDAVKALVTSYDSAAIALEKSFVLSLFSTFNTRAATMKTFKCTEHAVKKANLLARLRRLTIIKKTDESTFGRFAKETVAHMESWALHQDVVRRAAFSDRVSMRYILFQNKNRMHHNYVIHCECAGVKPLGKTSFFRFYNDNIFRHMTRETCACTQCVEDTMREERGVKFRKMRRGERR